MTITIMTTPKSKANVGMTLIILFVITLATGIILHLKKHDILIEPPPVIKMVHWIAGFLMVGVACLHSIQFKRMFSAMKTKFRWFRIDTWVVIVFVAITFITGLVKLLSPVKIPNLGLHHYWFA
ncbi:MAG: hypothetical protein K2N05_08170 [Muribaculaceae bacterium]|nr:hypothetical protein [Muribaculaceae bacterium]